MGLKVIAAGFSKTGTKSLTAALDLLGFRVYDFLEHAWLHNSEWERILSLEGSTEMCQKMYADDVDAVIDMPALHYWEEIHKAFPDSKIILTIRDEESWWRSMEKQIRELDENLFFRFIDVFSPAAYWLKRHLRQTFNVVCGIRADGIFRKVRQNEMLMKIKYRQHNAHVLTARANAPKDKLLVFRVEEGWAPLCKFLGVDQPDVPFPHKNKGAKLFRDVMEQHPIMQRIKKEVMFTFCVITCLSALAAWKLTH